MRRLCHLAIIAVVALCAVVPRVSSAAARATFVEPIPALVHLTALGSHRALRALRSQARSGNLVAESELGVLYAHGLGVRQNFPKTAHWYKKKPRRKGTPLEKAT